MLEPILVAVHRSNLGSLEAATRWLNGLIGLTGADLLEERLLPESPVVIEFDTAICDGAFSFQVMQQGNGLAVIALVRMRFV